MLSKSAAFEINKQQRLQWILSILHVCVGGELNKSQDFLVCKNVKRSLMNEYYCINDLPSLFPQVWTEAAGWRSRNVKNNKMIGQLNTTKENSYCIEPFMTLFCYKPLRIHIAWMYFLFNIELNHHSVSAFSKLQQSCHNKTVIKQIMSHEFA